MNLPSQKAWASLFWEWVAEQEDYNLPCYFTWRVNRREIASCTHMMYNPDLGGSFEGYYCPLHKLIFGEDTPGACLRRYRWIQDHCPEWYTLIERFGKYMDEVKEGEQR